MDFKRTTGYETLRTEMSRYMKNRPKACGISAPNFRHYVNYLVIRTPDNKGVEEMFNTRIIRFHDRDRTSLIRESNDMCYTKYRPETQVGRSGTITVEYQNFAGTTVTRDFSSTQSFCLQHYVDIVEGTWPCLSGQVRIPAYPKFRTGHEDL